MPLLKRACSHRKDGVTVRKMLFYSEHCKVWDSCVHTFQMSCLPGAYCNQSLV